MSAQNKQFGNVGNLGDILKHSALVSLAELILTRASRIVWVDTHAFLLEAPCDDPGAWKRETTEQLASYPDLGRYVTFQRNLAEPSRYRCSTGLVVDVVREASHEVPALILGESERATREHLEKQLARETLTPHVLMEHASSLRTVPLPPGIDGLLALVDPFTLDVALWADISASLARLTESLTTAIVLVFTYDHSVQRYEWPKAPDGFGGPVAVTSRRPFHLAVYAKGSIADLCRQRCEALGWDHSQTPTATTAQDTHPRARLKVRGFSRLRGLDDGRLLEELELAAASAMNDVRASLFHQRRFQERVVHLVAAHHRVDLSDCTDQASTIRLLEKKLGLNQLVVGPLHWLRQEGNRAAHEFHAAPNLETALGGLRQCHQIARWFAAETNATDMEALDMSVTRSDDRTPRQQRRDEKLLRKMQTIERINRTLKDEICQLRALHERRPIVTESVSLLDTVPVGGALQWVYFATPRKADRDTTYDLAYTHGIICCDVWKEGATQKLPNVKQMRPGEMMLLAYGEHGKYQPQLYLRIEEPSGRTIADTHVMHELPAELASVLTKAGYEPDPGEHTFTGFRVTPCSDWKGELQSTLRKPTGQNFLRRWDEVRETNGWDTDGKP